MLPRASRGVALAALLAPCIHAQSQSLREAARLDAEGKCDEAERLYVAALAGGSQSIALLNNVGNHYLVCGDVARAEEYFRRVLRADARHDNANVQMARLAAERKQGPQALEYLARVSATGPQVSLVRAEALHWAGRRAESLAILDEVEKTSRDDPQLLLLLALSCARLALYERAETVFSAALARRPGDFDLTYGLGRAAARAGHYDRAQRALEAALRMRPEEVEVLVELGRVCAARKDPVQAVFHLARARQKAPKNPDILLLLARAAEDAGYYDDAATAYDDYLRLRPTDDTARRDRARACGQTETRREEARKELAWYLAKHPADPIGHYAFALAFWWAEPENALQHLTEAARLEPESASIRFSRAWMLQRLGRMAESMPDLEAANRLAPGNVRILDLIGLAHLSAERPVDAERSFRKALAGTPEDPEVVMHMGRALMAQGREEEAQQFLEKYQKIRPQELPGLRKRTGMVSLATLPAAEQRTREIERCRNEAAQHPDRPDYQLHLSSLLLADRQKEQAMLEFRRLLELNATAAVSERAGEILLSAGEYSLARQFLQRAVEERPSARVSLAIALFHDDGPEAALELLKRHPTSEPTGDELLLEAHLLELAGRTGEAVTVLNRGLTRVSTQPGVVQTAASALVRLERAQDALKILDEAIRANPQDPDLALSRGIVLSVTGQVAAAQKVFEEAELRWPEWWRAYLAHGLLLEQQNRTAAAKHKLQTAAALGPPQDAAARCALSRLSRQSQALECACGARLDELLPGRCGVQSR